MVTLSSTAAFRLMLTNWLCSSLITFPCSSAIVFATRTSSPGLSGRSTDTEKIRSLWINPCCTMDDMVMTSILPPLKIQTTFLPVRSICFKAATERSPEFSTTILWFSTISRNAPTSSSSSTVRISSTFSITYWSVFSPTVFTAVPSAIVFALGRVTTWPAATAAFILAAAAGSTPITLILGFSIFASVEIPVISPPPPIGTKI